MGVLCDTIRSGSDADVSALLSADPDTATEFDSSGISGLMLALYLARPDSAAAIAALRPLDLFEAAALGDAGRLGELLADDTTLARAVAPDGFTPLHLAAYFGRPQAVDVLLQAGAEVNAEARNATLVQPLHSAVAGPEPMIARALVAAGADVNTQQQGGWTPLQAAAHLGHTALIELLLAAGADPQLTNDTGVTAADLARKGGHVAAFALLEAGMLDV